MDRKYHSVLYAESLREQFSDIPFDLFYSENNELVEAVLQSIIERFDACEFIPLNETNIPDSIPPGKTCIVKTSDDGCVIYYKMPVEYLEVLKYLAVAYLDLEKMDIGEVKWDCELHDFDGAYGLFARTLAMPRDEFMSQIAKYGFNQKKLVKHYNIGDKRQIYQRGIELNIWE